MHKLDILNNPIYKLCMDELGAHDKTWIKRKRIIDTTFIFDILFQASVLKQGVSTLLQIHNKCSPTALIKARSKIKNDIFYDINKTINKTLFNNIYAIDGSKVRVHEGFKNFGYKTRTNDSQSRRRAKKPLAMLSSLTGVLSDTIVDYTITKHFNERECIKQLVSGLNPHDIVIFDRGYYSIKTYDFLYNSNLDCIMRLKVPANKDIRPFIKSNKSSLITNIIYNSKIIPIRYIKYYIDDNQYIIGTTLLNASLKYIKLLYKLRWRVELSFKRLKSNLNINTIYSKTEYMWRQELQSRILIDTISHSIQYRHTKQFKKQKVISSKTKTTYNDIYSLYTTRYTMPYTLVLNLIICFKLYPLIT